MKTITIDESAVKVVGEAIDKSATPFAKLLTSGLDIIAAEVAHTAERKTDSRKTA